MYSSDKDGSQITLTVVIAVVSGKSAVRKNLKILCPQIDFDIAEVIVPYDKWSADVAVLVDEFPSVRFHYVDDLGLASKENVSAHKHRLFDRRRAVGLQLSCGKIVAMTEDHALPANDWVKQILAAHEQPYDAIGGAVENGIDRALNRALYYCDFGRYGRPFDPRRVEYVSDVNLAYKRESLSSIRNVWQEAYHETTVHWAMLSHGQTVFLDDRPVVYQMREGLTFPGAMYERVAWGRVFAETRSSKFSVLRRLLFAFGSPLLPPLMLMRAFGHMRRQQLSLTRTISTMAVAFLLLCGWSYGECSGYLFKEPTAHSLI